MLQKLQPGLPFFIKNTPTTEIYTLSLHDALPISQDQWLYFFVLAWTVVLFVVGWNLRSEEHTSELQSHVNLVCRLLLEKKKAGAAERHAEVALAMALDHLIRARDVEIGRR